MSTAKQWLVVTIDTEEEGLWSGQYSRETTVENIQAVPRFQALCDQFSIRPTYLITTPVAESSQATSVLRSILDAGKCEIGTHVHPWNSPPFEEQNSKEESYLCNLPPSIQLAKLENLTSQIERSFGVRPISFRAGRYGADAETINCLRKLGYLVDSSVLPGADYRSGNGPDFRKANCLPYYPNDGDILACGEDDSLLEIPVSAGFTHRYFEAAERMRKFAMRSPWRSLRAVGILDRLGIASHTKLSPEQASIGKMRRLATSILARNNPVLVLMFHSSSLLPRCSPYVNSEADLTLFLGRLEQFFEYAMDRVGLTPITLGECYQHREKITASMAPTSISDG